MFVSDFVKLYPKPCEVTFIKLASYEGVKSTEDIQRLIGLTQDLTGRTVVILEDIIDSGNTLEEVHRIFRNENESEKQNRFKIMDKLINNEKILLLIYDKIFHQDLKFQNYSEKDHIFDY